LKHLLNIEIEYLGKEEAKPGFKLIFTFSPNDYFENDVLEKTYIYQEEVGYSGDFVYDRAIEHQSSGRKRKISLRSSRSRSKETKTPTEPDLSERRNLPSHSSTSSLHLRQSMKMRILTRKISRRSRRSWRSITRSARI